MNKKYFFSVLLLSFSMVSTIKTMDYFGPTPDEIEYGQELEKNAQEAKGKRFEQLLAAINAQNHQLVEAIINEIYREFSRNDRINLINRPVDDQGTTLLIKAASMGNMIIVRLLLDSNADVTLTNADGQTAEQIARNNGHQEVAQHLYNYTHAIYK